MENFWREYKKNCCFTILAISSDLLSLLDLLLSFFITLWFYQILSYFLERIFKYKWMWKVISMKTESKHSPRCVRKAQHCHRWKLKRVFEFYSLASVSLRVYKPILDKASSESRELSLTNVEISVREVEWIR